MTRKDYIAIAAAFRPDVDRYTQLREVGVIERVRMEAKVALDALYQTAGRVAYSMKQDNPRFNEDTFMDACGF